MKASRLVVAAIVAVLSLSLALPARAQSPAQVWVDDDYCRLCLNEGHTWQVDAFATITAGLRAVASGGTVYVRPGWYQEEEVLIGRPCRLVAEGPGEAVLFPRFSDVTLTSAANSETVQGLTVAGGRRAAIQVVGPSFQREPIRSIVLRQNRVHGGYFGVAVNIGALASAVGEWEYGRLPAGDVEITDNTVSGCTRGIYVYNADATIAGNSVADLARDGIGIYSSQGSTSSIRTNTVRVESPNARAIYVLDNEGTTIDGNTLVGTTEPLTPTTALALYGYADLSISNNSVQGFHWGLNALTGGSVRIAGNTFERAMAWAISVGTSITTTEVTIENNVVRGAYCGVRLDDDGCYGMRASLRGNSFHDNVVGVLLAASLKKDQVQIRGNSFCGDVVAALRNESPVPVEASDNWWSANDGPRPGGSGELVEGLGGVLAYPWLRLQAATRTEPDGRVLITATLANERYRMPDRSVFFATDSGTFVETNAPERAALTDWRGEAQATLNPLNGGGATVIIHTNCGPGIAVRIAAPRLSSERQPVPAPFRNTYR